jgi:hypothetical protein
VLKLVAHILPIRLYRVNKLREYAEKYSKLKPQISIRYEECCLQGLEAPFRFL